MAAGHNCVKKMNAAGRFANNNILKVNNFLRNRHFIASPVHNPSAILQA